MGQCQQNVNQQNSQPFFIQLIDEIFSQRTVKKDEIQIKLKAKIKNLIEYLEDNYQKIPASVAIVCNQILVNNNSIDYEIGLTILDELVQLINRKFYNKKPIYENEANQQKLQEQSKFDQSQQLQTSALNVGSTLRKSLINSKDQKIKNSGQQNVQLFTCNQKPLLFDANFIQNLNFIQIRLLNLLNNLAIEFIPSVFSFYLRLVCSINEYIIGIKINSQVSTLLEFFEDLTHNYLVYFIKQEDYALKQLPASIQKKVKIQQKKSIILNVFQKEHKKKEQHINQIISSLDNSQTLSIFQLYLNLLQLNYKQFTNFNKSFSIFQLVSFLFYLDYIPINSSYYFDSSLVIASQQNWFPIYLDIITRQTIHYKLYKEYFDIILMDFDQILFNQNDIIPKICSFFMITEKRELILLELSLYILESMIKKILRIDEIKAYVSNKLLTQESQDDENKLDCLNYMLELFLYIFNEFKVNTQIFQEINDNLNYLLGLYLFALNYNHLQITQKIKLMIQQLNSNNNNQQSFHLQESILIYGTNLINHQKIDNQVIAKDLQSLLELISYIRNQQKQQQNSIHEDFIMTMFRLQKFSHFEVQQQVQDLLVQILQQSQIVLSPQTFQSYLLLQLEREIDNYENLGLFNTDVIISFIDNLKHVQSQEKDDNLIDFLLYLKKKMEENDIKHNLKVYLIILFYFICCYYEMEVQASKYRLESLKKVMNFGEIENIDREILDNQLNIYDKQFYVKARNRIMQMEKWILELGEKYEKSLFQIIRPKQMMQTQESDRLVRPEDVIIRKLEKGSVSSQCEQNSEYSWKDRNNFEDLLKIHSGKWYKFDLNDSFQS